MPANMKQGKAAGLQHYFIKTVMIETLLICPADAPNHNQHLPRQA